MAENTAMDIHEILNHLPHRYPFVLIDRVISMELGKEIFPRPLSLLSCNARRFNCRSNGTSCSYFIF
jgi:3-hydroxymyristoyl/3-hydroxydecanoyl-(acyl carrier protein) dehydratase